jgi:hypothetical protein
MSAKRVLIIGGHGFLGTTIAAAFAQSGWDVLRGSRSPQESSTAHVDLADPDTIRHASADVDLVVNTVPDTGLVAETVILHGGGLLLNVSTLPQRPVRTFRDHAGQTSHPGTVVFNAGLAPGITNLVIADLLRTHPHADGVEIAMALQTKGMSGRSGVHFVHENLAAASSQDKRIRHHATTRIPLPPPFGTRTCFGFGEGQGGWLLGTAGNRSLHTYGYIDANALHNAILGLNAMRLLSLLPIAPLLMGHNTIPATPTAEPVAHWLAVLHEGSRIAARTVRCSGDYHCTGVATVVTAEALLQSDADKPGGCFTVEELITLADVESALKQRGITVESELDPTPTHSSTHASGR